MTRFTLNNILGSVIVLFFTSALVLSLGAQTGSVRLEGIVWDPSGNPLPGTQLMAIEENTGRQSETLSDSDGYYRFLVMDPGIYTVTAKAKGFKDVVHRNIFLFAPGNTVENFSFEVSAIDKEIGPGERIQLLNSNVAAAFSPHDLDALPLLNRDPLALSIYQPGVQINNGSESYSTVNGTRRAMNSHLKDGMYISNPIDPQLGSSLLPTNPDSLSSLQIVTAGGNAEYGITGGAQVIMTSRSGGKSWSGNIYDYFRHRELNTNDFFNNSQGLPRPAYKRNIFGATLSGPIGSKTSVFGNFEGNRTNQQLPRNRAVLTSTAKAGVFQWYTPDDTTRTEDTVQSFDMVANDPRGLGIDPSVAALLAKLPDPNNDEIGDGLNTRGYRFDSPAYSNQERLNVRVDRDWNSRHRLYLRFDWNHTNATDLWNSADASFPGETSGTYKSKGLGFVLGSNYTLSPTRINELRIGYIKSDVDISNPSRLNGPMLLANSWTDPLNPSSSRTYRNPSFEISDFVSHAKNLHALKYGFSFRRSQSGGVDRNGVYPNVTFGIENGNIPDSSQGPAEDSDISADDRRSFEYLYNNLLGRIESVSQTFNTNLTSSLPIGTGRDRNYTVQELSGFIQDNWRIRPSLTLNFGLRYELTTAPKESNNYQVVLDQASQINSAANISNFNLVAGDSWYKKNLNNFAPRAGFSWDVFGTGSMVLRGSYGIYYNRLNENITDYVDQNSTAFVQNKILYPNASGTDLRVSDGIPLPVQPESPMLSPLSTRADNIAVLDPKLKTPRIHQYNLTLEKRMFGAIFEAGFVGTRGKNLFQFLNLNQTRTTEDFLQAFKEIQAYRNEGTPVSPSNTIAHIFGSPLAAMDALEGFNFDLNQVGVAADILDRSHYDKYETAGVSNFYLRNFPQFDKFLFGTNSAESWHNSLQFGIRKNTNNYHLRAYYTWSKSMDTLSSDCASCSSFTDSFQPKLSKAYSDFDRTHVLNVAWDYTLPIGRNLEDESDMPKWASALFGGWNLGTLLIWESGARFSVNSGVESLYAGVPSLANYEGKRNIGRISNSNGEVYWFSSLDAALFSNPKAGEPGSSGRNSFQGPRYFNLDVMLQKKFQIREKQSLQIRIEAYNALNNTHFALPNTNIFSQDFGKLKSTQGDSRTFQVAARYQF